MRNFQEDYDIIWKAHADLKLVDMYLKPFDNMGYILYRVRKDKLGMLHIIQPTTWLYTDIDRNM